MSERLLLDSMIKRARPRAKPYTLNDGGGLFVIIHPDAKRYFQFRYSYGKRQRRMQFGAWPRVTLAGARKLAEEQRAALSKGRDPITARRLGKLQKIAEVEGSFANIADAWLRRNKEHWSARNYQRHGGLLRIWLLPSLGPLPVKEIDTAAVLSVLREAEARGKVHTAHQARQTAKAIFRFAISARLIQLNPAGDISDLLKRRPKTQHHPALCIDQVGPMLRALEASATYPVTKAALRLALLLGLRDTTLRSAMWSEIDFNGAQWNCPPQHMKGRQDRKQAYSTPLPKQAIAVLKELHPLTFRGADSHVFPGSGKNGRVSPSTLGDALKRLGFNATTHGMRSLINTYLAECGFRLEAREAQLAHVHGDQTDQAYMRSNFWLHRVAMMQHWGNVVAALEAGKPVPQVEVENVRRLRA